MSNADLDSRAKALERDLQPKLKCYVKVGWMREADGSVIYMVYVDQRANIDYKLLPQQWYGSMVDVQLILPPGVKPPEPFPGLAW